MGNASSSDDDSSSTSSQYSNSRGDDTTSKKPPIPKGTPGTNTSTTVGELSQPGDRRVSLQKRKKRTAAAVQDASLGEDRPKKKARKNNNSHGVAGAVSKPRASKAKKAQPLPAAQVPPRGIGPVHDPNLNDVLSGRGKRIDENPGNVQFREIVAQYKEGYCKKTKHLEKARIVAQIVYRIRNMTPPGRFLKEDADGLWFDIGDAEAIQKVGEALGERDDAPYNLGGKKRKTWEQSYQELIGFHAIHGHTNIPQRDKWKSLYQWTYRQKNRRTGSCSHSKRPLTQDQIRKLDAIGFDWAIQKRGKTRDQGGPDGSGGDRRGVKNTEPVHRH